MTHWLLILFLSFSTYQNNFIDISNQTESENTTQEDENNFSIKKTKRCYKNHCLCDIKVSNFFGIVIARFYNTTCKIELLFYENQLIYHLVKLYDLVGIDDIPPSEGPFVDLYVCHDKNNELVDCSHKLSYALRFDLIGLANDIKKNGKPLNSIKTSIIGAYILAFYLDGPNTTVIDSIIADDYENWYKQVKPELQKRMTSRLAKITQK